MDSRRPKRSRRPRPRLSLEEVEVLVEKALDDLPEEYGHLLDNVFVTVEEEPSPADLEALGIAPEDAEREAPLGMYHGISHLERGTEYVGLPDRVVIYAGPTRRSCSTRRQMVEEIRKTLLHELGHHFGMGEDDMPY